MDSKSTQSDLLAQAGEILQRHADRQGNPSKSDAFVIAAAILAVAGGLRDVHNVLHEINMKLAARS